MIPERPQERCDRLKDEASRLLAEDRSRRAPIGRGARKLKCKRGVKHVYVVGVEGGDTVKVGVSGSVEQRVRSLQTGLPHKLMIYHYEVVPEHIAEKIEQVCHETLRKYRTRGEWFDVNPDYAILVVREMTALIRRNFASEAA